MVTRERKQTADRAMEADNEAMSRPTEMVKEYPVSSMLVVFSVGLGVGLVLSQALIPSFHESTMTERMGRQLYDSMCNLTSAMKRGIEAYT
ncbi:MAG: hypothetical protein L0211_27030 [Planctomycetaceae bacterium]|nr:hypothetical protein [Planctomycetaceae bacterium]